MRIDVRRQVIFSSPNRILSACIWLRTRGVLAGFKYIALHLACHAWASTISLTPYVRKRLKLKDELGFSITFDDHFGVAEGLAAGEEFE
ncbi:MAG: hypothetical protein ACI97A_004160 [Planctomycetota bacterium]|jgi:hypothetical protein